MSNKVEDFMNKYSPEILMSVGLCGLTFATVWGIKSTVQAVRLCDQKKANENKATLKPKEVIQTTWKLYLPVALATTISIPCIIAGNRVSNKRAAALTAAATLSQTALLEYQNKVKQIVSPKEQQKISESLSQDKVNNTKANSKEIVVLGDGNELFLETTSQRYFRSSWDHVQKMANEINERALSGVCGSYTLNDWYEKLGLEPTAIGDSLGWSTPGFGRNGLMKIYMDTAKTADDKPCGVINYSVLPEALV